jgi:hypothetical protein
MYGNLRTTAAVTMIAMVLHCSLPALAATGVRLEGTVEIACDPSRVSDVTSVQIQPVSRGAAVTVAVDPLTGKFSSPELTEGEYELTAIGADGKPLSPEPKKLLLRNGLNEVVLSMQPPGCVAQGSDGEVQSGEKPGNKDVKNWHLTLIYLGVVGAVILLLSDDEDPASPV